MVNKPKAIGTKAESAILKRLKRIFPTADRAVLHGAQDIGDFLNTGIFCFEAKGGNAAKDALNSASNLQIERWFDEARRETKAAGARIPVLVVQRRGVNYPDAGRWWAIIEAGSLWGMAVRPTFSDWGHGTPSGPLVRIELDDLLRLIESYGYGTHAAA